MAAADSLRYTEPLARSGRCPCKDPSMPPCGWCVRDASDASGYNDYYSFRSARHRQLQNNYDATIQYKWGEKQLGYGGCPAVRLAGRETGRGASASTRRPAALGLVLVCDANAPATGPGRGTATSTLVSGAIPVPSWGQTPLLVLNVGNPTRSLRPETSISKPYGYMTGTVNWYRNDLGISPAVMMSLSATMEAELRPEVRRSGTTHPASCIPSRSTCGNLPRPRRWYSSYAKPFGKEESTGRWIRA